MSKFLSFSFRFPKISFSFSCERKIIYTEAKKKKNIHKFLKKWTLSNFVGQGEGSGWGGNWELWIRKHCLYFINVRYLFIPGMRILCVYWEFWEIQGNCLWFRGINLASSSQRYRVSLNPRNWILDIISFFPLLCMYVYVYLFFIYFCVNSKKFENTFLFNLSRHHELNGRICSANFDHMLQQQQHAVTALRVRIYVARAHADRRTDSMYLSQVDYVPKQKSRLYSLFTILLFIKKREKKFTLIPFNIFIFFSLYKVFQILFPSYFPFHCTRLTHFFSYLLLGSFSDTLFPSLRKILFYINLKSIL